MSALLAFFAAQDPEFERQLTEFQNAVDAESSSVSTQPAARSTEAVSRLDTPSSRDRLWRLLSDPETGPATRLTIVEAILRLGEVRNVATVLDAIAQIRSSGKPIASRVAAAEEMLRRRNRSAVRIESTRRPAIPVRTPERNVPWTNIILGSSALAVAALLWLVRKGNRS